MSLTGLQTFDVTTASSFVYKLAGAHAQTIIVEFAANGTKASSGAIDIYSGAASGTRWFSVPSATLRVYPVPDGCEYVTIVPESGAVGLCTVSLSQANLGVGIYPFEGAASGSSAAANAPTIVQTTARARGNSQPISPTFAAAPTPGNLLVIMSGGNCSSGWTYSNGFHSLAQQTGSNNDVGIAVKIADGTERAIALSGFSDWNNAVGYEISGAGYCTPTLVTSPQQFTGSHVWGWFGQALVPSLVLGVFEQDGTVSWSAVGSPFVDDTGGVPTDSGNHYSIFMHASPLTQFFTMTATFSNDPSSRICAVLVVAPI